MFLLTVDTDSDQNLTSHLIINHIIILKEKPKEYFPSFPVDEYDRVHNHFTVT
jgi:hypothetical protein